MSQRNLPTTNLDSLIDYIHSDDGLGDLMAAHTAPQDELQALYDLAVAAKDSADMYRKDGFPFIAAEYEARGRAYARRWRELNSETRA